MSLVLLEGRGVQTEGSRAPKPCTASMHAESAHEHVIGGSSVSKRASKVRGSSTLSSFCCLAKSRTLRRPVKTITSSTLQTH